MLPLNQCSQGLWKCWIRGRFISAWCVVAAPLTFRGRGSRCSRGRIAHIEAAESLLVPNFRETEDGTRSHGEKHRMVRIERKAQFEQLLPSGNPVRR